MRRLPPLGALRAFEAAARLGSFARAAAELGVTPTAVSHQIRGLEAQCGRALFARRPLALTPPGEVLFPAVRDGLDRFAAVFAALRAGPGDIRVTTTNALAARCLVPLLDGFRAAHPAIGIEVIGTDAVLALGSEADVALRYARTVKGGVELARDRFYVMASPALLAAQGRVAWRRLPRIGYHWLATDVLAPDWPRWEAVAGETGMATAAMRFREELHAIEAVVAGQGMGILSDLLVRRELASGALVCLSPVSLEGYGVWLVAPEMCGPEVRAFSAWIRSVL